MSKQIPRQKYWTAMCGNTLMAAVIGRFLYPHCTLSESVQQVFAEGLMEYDIAAVDIEPTLEHHLGLMTGDLHGLRDTILTELEDNGPPDICCGECSAFDEARWINEK